MIALLLAAALLTPAETRGRQIYRQGESASGRAIVARIGGGEFGASLFPCATCHGADGRGVAEGTVKPADVRWSVLARRYDETSFARALQHGVDAGGNRLSPIMPRYRMSGADLADLVAYLKRLGDEPQPGVSDAALNIATLDPRARPLLEAFFADVNAGGGVHGRALQLRDAGEEVFAIVGGPPHETIPTITPFPVDAPPPSAFFLFSSDESQAAALLEHFGPATHTLRHTDDFESITEKRDDDVLLLTGPGVDATAILRRLEPLSWRPRILIAGASSPAGLLDAGPSFRNRIFLAAPSLPGDCTACRELVVFIERHDLPKTQLPATMATFAAARVFVEGLKRAGRQLTRENLMASLETLYRFETGLTPPVTYARGQHGGTSGAYLVAVDVDRRTFSPARDGWIAPRE